MSLQHSTLVFGPQTSSFDPTHLSSIRNSLVSNPRLQTFHAAIIELSGFLPTLHSHDPSLQKLPALESCQTLSTWLTTGQPISQDRNLPNQVCTPLTVIIHVVHFFNYLSTHHGSGPIHHHHAYDDFLASSPAIGAQGFCIGFLTAAAVSCATDEAHLVQLCCNALRLAFCIGAYVDLDLVNAGDELEATCVMVCWNEKNKPKQDVWEFLNGVPDVSFVFF